MLFHTHIVDVRRSAVGIAYAHAVASGTQAHRDRNRRPLLAPAARILTRQPSRELAVHGYVHVAVFFRRISYRELVPSSLRHVDIAPFKIV